MWLPAAVAVLRIRWEVAHMKLTWVATWPPQRLLLLWSVPDLRLMASVFDFPHSSKVKRILSLTSKEWNILVSKLVNIFQSSVYLVSSKCTCLDKCYVNFYSSLGRILELKRIKIGQSFGYICRYDLKLPVEVLGRMLKRRIMLVNSQKTIHSACFITFSKLWEIDLLISAFNFATGTYKTHSSMWNWYLSVCRVSGGTWIIKSDLANSITIAQPWFGMRPCLQCSIWVWSRPMNVVASSLYLNAEVSDPFLSLCMNRQRRFLQPWFFMLSYAPTESESQPCG